MQRLVGSNAPGSSEKTLRAEQLRTLRLEAIEQLATASGLAQCASGVVAAICRNLQWDCGMYWTVIPAGAALECIASYDDAATASFVASSISLRLRHGEGLPGRVSASREPAWIVDVANAPNFPRASAAIASGLHSAFACPVLAGDGVLGVLEFFTREFREPDAELLETMSTVTGAFAQFIERWSAEEKLRRSERDLNDFFENANIGLHWVAGDGTILRANRAELDMLGYSADEYVGHHIAEFHADADVIGDILKRLTGGEKLRDYPARMRCKDGSLRDVLIHSSVLWDEGRFVHTRCFTRDVTAEKRAARALGASESRFRALMEQAPFSIQILAPDGTTVEVNRAWRELWGITLEDIAGYNVLSDPQLEAKGVAPLLRQAFAGAAVRIPAIAYDPNETLPERSRHRDPVRWVTAVAYPLKDESGEIREVVLVHEDITARRRSEEALRESEEKLRLLADTIPQLAWMLQPNGEATWFNRRWYEYTGTAPEEAQGWGWQSVHDPAALPEILERWKRCMATGEPFDMVLTLRGRDGRFRPFLTRINPLRAADNRILYWFGTGTDIGELKRMEQALRDADRRKDEFLATLAHELRNPLAPISNSLQILKMPHVDGDTSRLTRQVMERQVQHLVRLVDDLLDVSRVMRGRIDLRREHVELSAVIARAVETAQPLLDAKSHRLGIEIADESIAVHVDPVRMTQVFGNLLTNAARYTDDGGEIKLSARREGSDAVVEIRDSGVGIAPEMLPLIFELFVQADPAGLHSQGGLGIGLTLARNLVEMHGGTLEASSAGIGTGATFTVRVPLASGASSPLAQKEAPAASDTKQLRLLVVDDNKDAAVTLATLLRLRGHEVLIAHDGKTALAVASAYRPQLIFLDIGMPGMDGYEVARTIRSMPELRETCIAALTGWGQPEDLRRAREAGCDHHLVKPPDAQAVDGLLASLIR